MKKYKVSVIIPVYNIDKYISKCLDSIINQSIFNDIEVIVVNDGSTDESYNICLEYSKKYNNIFLFSQKNSGVSSARNYGMKRATGKYIIFIDGDDFIDSNYIELLLVNMDNGQYDLVISDYWIYQSDLDKKSYRNSSKIKIWNDKNEIIRDLLSGNEIGNNLFDKLFVTKLVNSIKFDENIKIGEDLLFIYFYLKKINKIKGIFVPGYYYVQRPGSAMNSQFNQKQFDILKVEQIIKNDITKSNSDLINYEKAFEIHCKYKILERAYKSFDFLKNEKEIENLKNDIKNYKLTEGFKYLSKRHFIGLVLIRYLPKLYLYICKKEKI